MRECSLPPDSLRSLLQSSPDPLPSHHRGSGLEEELLASKLRQHLTASAVENHFGIQQAAYDRLRVTLLVVPRLDLARYETPREEPDDFRHRMLANIAAFAFTVALTAVGIWLAMSIADLRKTQDCVLMGRRDCVRISAP